jgi:hypothetical protein
MQGFSYLGHTDQGGRPDGVQHDLHTVRPAPLVAMAEQAEFGRAGGVTHHQRPQIAL